MDTLPDHVLVGLGLGQYDGYVKPPFFVFYDNASATWWRVRLEDAVAAYECVAEEPPAQRYSLWAASIPAEQILFLDEY